jgi:sortase A
VKVPAPASGNPVSRRTIAALAVGLIVASCGGAALVAVAHGNGSHAAAAVPPPTTTTSAPTTTTRPPTTTTTRALPQPTPPPADPYADVPITQIGTIEIPKIGLLHPIFEGVWLTVVDHGPGHWPGSAKPCQAGNTVFPGHRVTHTHPFLDLDRLSPGDQIVFHMPGRDCVYKVTGTQIVLPTALYVTDPTATPSVTLIACNPKHSAAQRIVVKGTLVADIARPA